jgi:AraC-like DNA-binding protein
MLTHHTPGRQLLDAFARVRTRSADEASERIGRIFSPHRLEVRGDAHSMDVRHNRFQLCDVSINVLRYGTEVLIDPGERGDFYMVQLPLQGCGRLSTGRCEIELDPHTLSVLQPQTRSRMTWSGDCTMILVQVPTASVAQRVAQWDLPGRIRLADARSREDSAVGGWWQAVLDLTHNIDRFGDTWLRQPAAAAAVEELLLSAFTTLLQEPDAACSGPRRGDERCMRQAREYIEAHGDRVLTLAEIARHACVSPRTLEAVFKRHGEPSPLAFARRHRLQQVHDRLREAWMHGREVNVSQVAMAHGFLHLGRFAAQYREQYGVPPSQTLRPH